MNEQSHARGADVPIAESGTGYAHTLTHEFELNSQEEALRLLGFNGELRRRLQDQARVRIVDRGTRVVIIGEEADAAVAGIALQGMLDAVRMGHTPTIDDVDIALAVARDREQRALGRMLAERPAAIRADVNIRPRTRGQHRYLEAIHRHDITLAVGPAGTGKTFLAMAAAVSALLNREVKRLVLTRPAVEAGERLGFLPGDLEQKVNPYLRPLYDALFVLLDMERARRLMEQQSIEVAPLAFMRGRTLDHAFIILDEAQNTTIDQMLMFLTRLGAGSRAVVAGDITQVDLPKGVESGLGHALGILDGVPGIGVVRLTGRDVVRHPLVQRIIDAYESGGRTGNGNRPNPNPEGMAPDGP